MSHARNEKGAPGPNSGSGEPGHGPATHPAAANPTNPNLGESARAESNRPVGPGAGKHRGDRRDTSKAFTNNAKVRENHTNPPGSGSRGKGNK